MGGSGGNVALFDFPLCLNIATAIAALAKSAEERWINQGARNKRERGLLGRWGAFVCGGDSATQTSRETPRAQ